MYGPTGIGTARIFGPTGKTATADSDFHEQIFIDTKWHRC